MIGYSEADRHPLRWASGHLKPQGGLVSSVLQVCCGVNLAFSFVFAKGGRICLVSISFTKPSPAQTGHILVVWTMIHVVGASEDTMRVYVSCRNRGGGVLCSCYQCTREGMCLDGYGCIQTTFVKTGRKNVVTTL